MRFLLWAVFLAVLATTVSAWTKEDHEIFDLVNAVEESEGEGTTFYSWLDVSPTAPTPDIIKAYRKLSMQIHPDKNPNVKNVHERFSRLSVVAAILKNEESRERYDFFFKNGVPKWRGTGYYYSRFRPGLGSVLIFLAIMSTGLQYVIQRINYSRDLARVERIVNEARMAAWGPKMTPTNHPRKVKVNLSGTDEGKWIEMIVDGETVYIAGIKGEREIVDSSVVRKASISSTWLIGFVLRLLRSESAEKLKL